MTCLHSQTAPGTRCICTGFLHNACKTWTGLVNLYQLHGPSVALWSNWGTGGMDRIHYQLSIETIWELCIPFQSEHVMKYTLRLMTNFSIYKEYVSLKLALNIGDVYIRTTVRDSILLAMNGILYITTLRNQRQGE